MLLWYPMSTRAGSTLSDSKLISRCLWIEGRLNLLLMGLGVWFT